MASSYRASCTIHTSLLHLLVLVIIVATVTRSEWVDYPSGIRCGVTIPVEQCDPDDPVVNNACRDVCHYGGCRKGGHCVSPVLGVARGCHCKV